MRRFLSLHRKDSSKRPKATHDKAKFSAFHVSPSPPLRPRLNGKSLPCHQLFLISILFLTKSVRFGSPANEIQNNRKPTRARKSLKIFSVMSSMPESTTTAKLMPIETYWNDQISGKDIYNRSAYNSRQTMHNSTYLCVQV